MALAIQSAVEEDAAILTLSGELDASAAPALRDQIEALAGRSDISRLVLVLDDLSYMASAGLRALVFAKQKLGAGVELFLVGTQDSVAETIELTGFHHSVTMLATYEACAQPSE